MNMLVGALTFVPLLAVAFAHFFWSIGYIWPIRDEQLLVDTVVGTAGATRMPNRLLMFCMAVLIFLAGVVALALADHDSGGASLTGIGIALALVFLARGVLGYVPAWQARHPVEPFATLDRKNFSPLCFWIGAGFLILVLLRLT